MADYYPKSDAFYAPRPLPLLFCVDPRLSSAEFNAGLERLMDRVSGDPLLKGALEVGVVAFGNPPALLHPLQEEKGPFQVEWREQGEMDIAATLDYAIGLIEEHKRAKRDECFEYYCPHVVILRLGRLDEGPLFVQRRIATLAQERKLILVTVNVMDDDNAKDDDSALKNIGNNASLQVRAMSQFFGPLADYLHAFIGPEGNS